MYFSPLRILAVNGGGPSVKSGSKKARLFFDPLGSTIFCFLKKCKTCQTNWLLPCEWKRGFSTRDRIWRYHYGGIFQLRLFSNSQRNIWKLLKNLFDGKILSKIFFLVDIRFIRKLSSWLLHLILTINLQVH